MKRFSILVTLFVLLAVCAFGDDAFGQEEFQVIVNKENPVSELSASDLSRIFTKVDTSFDDGSPIIAIDQGHKSAVKNSFSQAIHNKSAARLKSYWQKQIFAGRGVPPKMLASDAEVLAFVKSNPGAIGYVSADVDISEVKIVEVK